MISLLKLIRYKNLLMVLLTMVLTKYALLKYVPELNPNRNVQFLILIASVLLITAGGYVINDIYDVKADTINKPNKVFIDVLISKKKAWIAYFLLTFLGLILGIYISFRESSPYNSIYFIIIAILLFSYSFYFKKTILLGNVIVFLK